VHSILEAEEGLWLDVKSVTWLFQGASHIAGKQSVLFERELYCQVLAVLAVVLSLMLPTVLCMTVLCMTVL
jgi:hypothetical protein